MAKLAFITKAETRLKMSDSPSAETEIPRHLLQSQTLLEANDADSRRWNRVAGSALIATQRGRGYGPGVWAGPATETAPGNLDTNMFKWMSENIQF